MELRVRERGARDREGRIARSLESSAVASGRQTANVRTVVASGADRG